LSVFRRAPLTGWTIGLSLRGSPAVSALPKLDDKFFDALFIEPDHPELYPTSSMRDSVKRLSLSQQQDTSRQQHAVPRRWKDHQLPTNIPSEAFEARLKRRIYLWVDDPARKKRVGGSESDHWMGVQETMPSRANTPLWQNSASAWQPQGDPPKHGSVPTCLPSYEPITTG
jgi:hypothetical protein